MSSRYQPAKQTTAAEPISLASASGDIHATLNAVIVRQGPGSWKRDAYWDEYIVAVTNPSDVTVTLRCVSLIGLAGETASAGTDPWQLEKQSQTRAEKNYGLAKNTAVHVGGGVTTLAAGAGIGAVTAGSGGTIVSATALGAAVGAMVAIPVFAGTTIYRNVHGRHQIQREFNRRRIELPWQIAPGESRQGSFFFPITPGPKTLTFATEVSNGCAQATTIDLTRISQLHLVVAKKD